jgi:hypothetical protein
MLDKSHQPFVVDRIKEPTNVRIEHPVDLPAPNGNRQRIQRITCWLRPGRNP